MCGIDCGSESCKVVLLGEAGIAWNAQSYGNLSTSKVARRVFEDLLTREQISLKHVTRIVCTGVGKKSVEFAHESVSEILCLAKAAGFLFPDAKSAVDVGARTLTAVRCWNGRVLKFVTSNRCASATGIFLKMAASLLGVKLEDFDLLFSGNESLCELQSSCAVFAESELISLIHEGRKIEELIGGVISAVSGKILTALQEIGAHTPLMISGGVARLKSIRFLLEKELGSGVLVPEDPSIVTALGAALIAEEKIR